MPAPVDEYAWAAPVYDLATARALAPLRRELAGLAHEACPNSSLSLLDVCCGTGQQCRMFEQAGLIAVGVDLSPSMLAKARCQANRSPLVRCDAVRLPFASHSFEFCSITLALHEKPAGTGAAIVLEMLRVTKPGGLVAVTDYLSLHGVARRLLGLGITGVERLAGREHHACYATWMLGGGLEGFLARMGVEPLEIRTRMFGLLGIAVIRR